MSLVRAMHADDDKIKLCGKTDCDKVGIYN